MARALTPTCAYRVDAGLVEALDRHLGPPLDSYVRGWQVWLEDNGPAGETLEWRLHPPAGFRMPRGVNPHDLFETVLQGLAGVEDARADAIDVGEERRRLGEIWEVLEVFPAFTADADPRDVVRAAARAIGRTPDVAGRVDHDRLGGEWKGRRGDFSVGRLLLETLGQVEG
jgi:hypothetical protein